MEDTLKKKVTDLIDRYEDGDERLSAYSVLEELEEILDNDGTDPGLGSKLRKAADRFILRRHEARRAGGRIDDGSLEFIEEVEGAAGYGDPGTGRITEVQRRLVGSIDADGGRLWNRALGLAAFSGADPEEMTGPLQLARWLEGAPADVKELFLERFNAEDNLRVCSRCGKFMTEGYILAGEYACSDECALALYDGDADRLAKDIGESLEGGIDDCFWTEW